MKNTIFIMLICVLSITSAYSQTYYNMWRGDGDAGRPEWISNFSTVTNDAVTGIEFTTANECRGFVNGSGKWGFLSPSSQMAPISLSNIVNGIDNVTVGVLGWVGAEGISVRQLWDGVTNTLDLLTTGSRSTITSNGDSEGIHIKSSGGHKIYLYDRVHFNDKYWTWMGAGRNDDPTIYNPNSKLFRIGSSGGLGFWADNSIETDDTPQLSIYGQNIGTTVPLTVKSGTIQILLGGVNNNADAWLGTKSAHGVSLGTQNKQALYIGTDQKLYVGLTKEDVGKIGTELKNKYTMFVGTGVLAEDYAIAPKSTWSDIVFSKDYELMKISEVEDFIQEHKHLPNIPSAQEVSEVGYNQHEMNKALLQKIEELTLYTIQQQKEIEALKKELESLK